MAMVINTHGCIYNYGTFWYKNIVLLGKETPSTTSKYLLKHKMSDLKSSAINFSAKVMEKNSPWLYNHGTFNGEKYCTLKRLNAWN